jgi:predicted alpha/beta-hydrolase family hydrolase
MGSRIGCHVCLEKNNPIIKGVICLGYPLNKKDRERVLLDMKLPILFVHGTRDKLGPLKSIQNVIERMTAPVELLVVEDGDHSLHVKKSSEMTQEQSDSRIIEHIEQFISQNMI